MKRRSLFNTKSYIEVLASWKSIASPVIYWSGLSIALAINVLALTYLKPQFWQERIDMLATHSSMDAHVHLAQQLWGHGFENQAKMELQLAQDLYGAKDQKNSEQTHSPDDIWKQWKQEPLSIIDAMAFWRDVAAKRPDYPDAYVQLAKLSYQQFQAEDTISYIRQAQALDPSLTFLNSLRISTRTD